VEVYSSRVASVYLLFLLSSRQIIITPRGSKIQSSRQDCGHFPAKYLPVYRLLKSWKYCGISTFLLEGWYYFSTSHHHRHRSSLSAQSTTQLCGPTPSSILCPSLALIIISFPPGLHRRRSSSYHRAVNKIIISNHASRTQEAP